MGRFAELNGWRVCRDCVYEMGWELNLFDRYAKRPEIRIPKLEKAKR